MNEEEHVKAATSELRKQIILSTVAHGNGDTALAVETLKGARDHLEDANHLEDVDEIIEEYEEGNEDRARQKSNELIEKIGEER